ncbi:histidine--tRNA ligase [Kamptonema cortianum]|nr:histidine--tRNA ligase [Geitlerinema splendidum]MDK3156093.1 histidine--tRNA ligase [Kamptonema cortianum]
MPILYQKQRGTEDIFSGVRPNSPAFEIHRWQKIQAVFAEIARLYGYGEIRTPMFEDFELFVRSSGETSDIVSKEMYDFKDKGDRHLALKPEGTAPVMRAYLEHKLGSQGGIHRFWYFNHSFRYGRPQKGRYRQLHQLGLECIGTDSALADVEIIDMTYRFLCEVGLKSLNVGVNSIGKAATRAAYGQAIVDHLAGWLAEQSTEDQARARKNPMRLLDTKDPALRDKLQGLPSILEFLDEEAKTRFDQVQAGLTQAGVPFVIDSSIVRGLDYYTDTVFECTDAVFGASLALCGGGRYDGLIQELGGPPTPSVGVGIGVERLIMALLENGVDWPHPQPVAFVVCATEDAASVVFETVAALRAAGMACLRDIEGKSLKQQFKQADRSGARFAIVFGSEELAKGTATIKVLASGDQMEIGRDDMVTWLKERS